VFLAGVDGFADGLVLAGLHVAISLYWYDYQLIAHYLHNGLRADN
jgi:hypothetical protein